MLTVKIKTDNAAFTGMRGEECARILRELAKRIENADTETVDLNLYDANGNCVGSAHMPRKLTVRA